MSSIVPVSLFAKSSETSARPLPFIRRERNCSGSMRPFSLTGISVSFRPDVVSASADGDGAHAVMRGRDDEEADDALAAARAPATAPRSASALASVPPLVNTTSPALAPAKAATCSRASATRAATARPAAWPEDGLPHRSSALSTEAFASGRSGDVAL
ncbi:MAG: hypothetical protein WDM81_15410 [Rhizomicrobium sp.]